MSKGKRITYSSAELEFLKQHETTQRRDLTILFNVEFKRNISYENINSKCKRMKLKTGRTGQFKKGNIPWSANTKGLLKGSSTSFKKGNIPSNRKHVGSETITSDGYIKIKISDGNLQKNYILKQVHVWQQHNGPVPKGHKLTFKDCDQLNCSIDNLLLVSNAELMYINQIGLQNKPKHIRPAIRALAKLQAATNKKRKSFKA